MAIPPRLHVGITFMLEFIFVISFLGGVVPWLHKDRGLSWLVLVPASAAVVVGVFFLIASVGKWIPVRCRQCGARSRYHGLGWWPFIYRYSCSGCGAVMRYEVTGG